MAASVFPLLGNCKSELDRKVVDRNRFSIGEIKIQTSMTGLILIPSKSPFLGNRVHRFFFIPYSY